MKPLILFLAGCCMLPCAARAERVAILHDAAVPQIAYSARKLNDALIQQKHEITRERSGYDRLVSLALNPVRLGSEAFAIIPEGKVITIYGGDLRGLTYGG